MSSDWGYLIRSALSPPALLTSLTSSQIYSFFWFLFFFASLLPVCYLLQLLGLILSPMLDWAETVCEVFPRVQSACCSSKFVLSEPSSPSVSELSEFLWGILGHSDNMAAAFWVCENIPSQNVQGNNVVPRQMMHYRQTVPILVGFIFYRLFREIK